MSTSPSPVLTADPQTWAKPCTGGGSGPAAGSIYGSSEGEVRRLPGTDSRQLPCDLAFRWDIGIAGGGGGCPPNIPD